MKTLVLKCQERVNNDDLRSMNELRIRCISTGTGANKINLKPTQSDGTYKGVIEYNILSGNGYFVNSSNVRQESPYNFQGYAGVIVPSGESVVQIKNFDLMTDVIGYENTPFVTNVNSTDFPDVVIDTKELKNKTFLKQINIPGMSGDISDLAGLTDLIYLKSGKNKYPRTGKLSSLRNLKKLEKLIFIDITNLIDVTISYSLNDLIAMTALSECSLYGGTFEGGDVYSLLNSKSYVNFILQRNTAKIENATCSYVSGTSPIPKFTLKKLELGMTSTSGVSFISVAVAKAILTLIKDGINAHTADSSTGITLDSGAIIELGLLSSPDSELYTLRNEVMALGVTVTLYT